MNCSKSRAGAVVADEASRGRNEVIISVAEAELIKAGAKMAAAARRKNNARASLVVIATTPVHATCGTWLVLEAVPPSQKSLRMGLCCG